MELAPGEIVCRSEGNGVGAHFVRVAGDDHGTHVHEELQIFVSLSGTGLHGYLQGGSGSQRRFAFDPGETLVVDAMQEHRFDWTFAEMTSIFVRPERIADLLAPAYRRVPTLGDVRRISDPLIVHYATTLGGLIRTSRIDPLALEDAADSIVLRLAQIGTGRSPSEAVGEERAWRRTVDYVEARLDGSLTLAQLATVADLPQHSLNRWFRRRAGISPHRWVRARRLDRAKQYLTASRMDLTDIALATGFAHQSHFTQVFRQAEGVTPAGFRRLAKGR